MRFHLHLSKYLKLGIPDLLFQFLRDQWTLNLLEKTAGINLNWDFAIRNYRTHAASDTHVSLNHVYNPKISPYTHDNIVGPQ